MSETNGDELINSALAIRLSRAIEENLRDVSTMKRLALENQVAEILDFQRTYIEQRDQSQQKHVELMASVVDALERVLSIVENPPVPPTPPDTHVTLTQQPVTVNVPAFDAKPELTFSPVVTIPEAKVVIDRPEAPKRATIKHSDGTRSEIIFESE